MIFAGPLFGYLSDHVSRKLVLVVRSVANTVQHCIEDATMTDRALTKGKLSAEINVTPMADIMLVLLIIFMITTPLLQSEVSVNLPKAENPLNAQDQGAAVVVLSREGRIYLGRTELTEAELYRTHSERLASDIDKSLFLKADESLPHGRVVHFVDGCRKLGVERIGLMAEKQSAR